MGSWVCYRGLRSGGNCSRRSIAWLMCMNRCIIVYNYRICFYRLLDKIWGEFAKDFVLDVWCLFTKLFGPAMGITTRRSVRSPSRRHDVPIKHCALMGCAWERWILLVGCGFHFSLGMLDYSPSGDNSFLLPAG